MSDFIFSAGESNTDKIVKVWKDCKVIVSVYVHEKPLLLLSPEMADKLLKQGILQPKQAAKDE